MKAKVLVHKKEPKKFGAILDGYLYSQYDVPLRLFSKSCRMKDIKGLINNKETNLNYLKEFELRTIVMKIKKL